ncbi:MAG: TolC family protein [Eubacteriales bacterium]|nr:TolC family protein [Eubacteriales bacterium]
MGNNNNNNNIQKNKKTFKVSLRASLLLLFLCMGAGSLSVWSGLSEEAFVMRAYAQQSPDFAYSSEVWAELRNNDLNFDEIDKLVHEYNPTVLKNAVAYKNQADKTSTDISNSYYDSASQILNNIQYPDPESSNYASSVSSYLNSQISYENMMEKGDTNTNDSETYKLGYDKTEAQLVKTAKALMVSYWSQYYTLQTLKDDITSAENDLSSVILKISAGSATESQKLTAEQKLQSARASLNTAEAKLASTKEELCLMLGWGYGEEVNIGSLPEITRETVDAIDLNADIETAKANNYTLRSTEKQLANARTEAVISELTVTRDTAVKNIEADITDLYSALCQSLTSLESASDSLSSSAASLAAARRKSEAGMMTAKDLASAESSYRSAETNLKTKQCSLVNAYINYKAAVDGLAET